MGIMLLTMDSEAHEKAVGMVKDFLIRVMDEFELDDAAAAMLLTCTSVARILVRAGLHQEKEENSVFKTDIIFDSLLKNMTGHFEGEKEESRY